MTMTTTLAGALILVSIAAASVTEQDKTIVVEAVAEHLATDYVGTEVGRDAAVELRRLHDDGAFASQRDGKAFADAITTTLHNLTDDGHLGVQYSDEPLAVSDEGKEDFAADERERWYGAHLNFGVQKAERLDGNVGLLDLRVFAPPEMGGDTVSAAMTTLAHTDALIVDLRQNGGGIGHMAALVASYLFDDGQEPQPLSGTYDGRTDSLTQNFTMAYVPGDRFGLEKPVYILISPRTFSAAEGLAYDLQALDRAIVVGEPSGGGAHPFEYLPVHPHFVLSSVTQKSVNPITRGNWQGTGVQPDINVAADKALESALSHFAARRENRKGR